MKMPRLNALVDDEADDLWIAQSCPDAHDNKEGPDQVQPTLGPDEPGNLPEMSRRKKARRTVSIQHACAPAGERVPRSPRSINMWSKCASSS